jgi:predicted RNA binding protein YcfA (HicA-like mRNA interferase family)
MPAWGPVSRRQLITVLRRLGFEGPLSGAKHQFMVRGDRVLTIPNPHRGDIGVELLTLVLRQAGISRREWERA